METRAPLGGCIHLFTLLLSYRKVDRCNLFRGGRITCVCMQSDSFKLSPFLIFLLAV